jgi:hypothetical protein
MQLELSIAARTAKKTEEATMEMEKELSKTGLRFLFALLLSALALPAWGANPNVGPMAPKPAAVTSVTASVPLASTGGTTPNIYLSGMVPVGNGGTGTTDGLASVQKKIGRVAIVAQSGGDYTDPITAMANVSTWCGTPSVTSHCLVKIMPGEYDLAGGSLTMQAYVDIEGSGEATTIISSAFTYNRDSGPGVVNGADNAELRFLTVQDKTLFPPYRTLGIVNNGQSPKITHVIVSVGEYFAKTSMQTSIFPGGSVGVYNVNSSPTMSNVTVKATGDYSNTGMFNENASPTMSNVMVTAEGGDASIGVYNSNSSPTMTNVTVRALNAGSANTALYNTSTSAITILVDRSTFDCGFGSSEMDSAVSNGSNVALRIGASKLIGPIGNSGTITCAASYNGDYVALGTNCQ